MLIKPKTIVLIVVILVTCVGFFVIRDFWRSGNDDLAGLNLALKKLNQYPMGVCPGPSFIFLGKYTGQESMKVTALRLLQKRNPEIKESDLIEKKNPLQLMNFTTTPPTPSTGPISADLLKTDGSVESYDLYTPDMIDEQLSQQFIDTYSKHHWGESPLCGTQFIDTACIGSIDFNHGDILMYVNNGPRPC